MEIRHKKIGPRAANERARKETTDVASLAAKPPQRKPFDFVEFMRAPDFKTFLRAFPTLAPSGPATQNKKPKTELESELDYANQEKPV